MWLFWLITTLVFLPALAAFGYAILAYGGPFRDGKEGAAIVGVALALFAGGLTGFFYWLSYGTEQTVTFVVEDEERIAETGDGKWMVYAKDGTTYENTDAWLHGKTNSTDLRRDIVVGNKLRCKINGVRWSLLSRYKNLLACRDLTTGKLLRSNARESEEL